MKHELLAPAGDLEKMEWACAYGADAVYFGIKDFSLRNFADNFDLEQAEKGINFLHDNNKKAYAAMNIYPFSEEIPAMLDTARELSKKGIDGLIVSDLGFISQLRKNRIDVPLHISTQANSLNYQTVLAYKDMGAARVNLARELSLQKIEEIQKQTEGQGIETEVFIHGAVCFSYSGRCAISDYLTGRRANRGECTHPCRWKYYVSEEKREGQYFPVSEDKRGLYIFNNKDLALFPYVSRLKELNIASFKIEGRMKTVHYLATVISLYRKVLDGEQISTEEGLSLLNRIPNRGYSHGFIKGNITPDDYKFEEIKDNAESIFVANSSGQNELRVRNKINAGETLEMLSPKGIRNITMPSPLVKKNGARSDTARNEDILVIEEDIPPYSVLRRLNKSNGS